MKFNARIPVIPLPYSSIDENTYKPIEKELVIDYGAEGGFPNLYVMHNGQLVDITDGIRQSILNETPADNFTVTIEGLGVISVGEILNTLYTISLTHKEEVPFDITAAIPTTIVDNNGIIYAPRTLSKNVYTENGKSIDEKLQAISKIGTYMDSVPATEELQSTFLIPFPETMPNYLEEGNSFWIYVGGVLVPDYRYQVTEDGKYIKFIYEDDYVEFDRDVVFLFCYNSATPDTKVLVTMDGKYITPKSIETNRLSSVSHSIDYNATDTVASAKAVCTLRNVLNARIDAIAGNTCITCFANEESTSSELIVTIPNYELVDTNMIHVRLRHDLAPNATLRVNDSGAIPIYDGNNRVQAGPKAGEIINLSYNSLEQRFYIYGVSSFKLETFYDHKAPEVGTSEISFNLPYDTLVDKLDVYYNGIKLFPNINYTLNNSSITLSDFKSEAGDLFTFELTQIVPVKK